MNGSKNNTEKTVSGWETQREGEGKGNRLGYGYSEIDEKYEKERKRKCTEDERIKRERESFIWGREAYKYGIAGAVGRGYALTWQQREGERERVCVGVVDVDGIAVCCWSPKHSTTHASPRGTTETVLLPFSRLLSLFSCSLPHHPRFLFLFLILSFVCFSLFPMSPSTTAERKQEPRAEDSRFPSSLFSNSFS